MSKLRVLLLLLLGAFSLLARANTTDVQLGMGAAVVAEAGAASRAFVPRPLPAVGAEAGAASGAEAGAASRAFFPPPLPEGWGGRVRGARMRIS